MLGRIPDSIMLAVLAFCMGGACHDMIGLAGQGVYVGISGGLCLLSAVTALDCWFGFAGLGRLTGTKA